jgi:hypothetical protein
MKLTVVYEMTFDRAGIANEYSEEFADDYVRLLNGECLDEQHYEGYSEEALRLFARDAIFGRRNHGTDAATTKTITILKHKEPHDVFHGVVRCEICSK